MDRPFNGPPHTYVRVLNQDAPTGRRAIGPDQGRIPVTARIVWADEDGEQHIEAHATRWTKTQVFVVAEQISRKMAGTQGVWIPASDVVRR